MVRDDFHDEDFSWLSEVQGVPNYLRLMHPHRGEHFEPVLATLRAFASWLRDRPQYWADLIRTRNWRRTLIGCSAVLLVREARFLDDLLHRFREGSWVAPQLAVALGLVHPVEAVTEFERTVREHGSTTDFKGVFSAYAVLKLMGREAAEGFEASDLFRRSQTEGALPPRVAHDSQAAPSIVRSYWEFWISQEPG